MGGIDLSLNGEKKKKKNDTIKIIFHKIMVLKNTGIFGNHEINFVVFDMKKFISIKNKTYERQKSNWGEGNNF